MKETKELEIWGVDKEERDKNHWRKKSQSTEAEYWKHYLYGMEIPKNQDRGSIRGNDSEVI